jgi:hypothetical protein
MFDSRLINGATTVKPLREVPFISTNSTAQWCLNAIQLLEMIGDQLSESHALWSSSENKAKGQ